jgi:hypothetical protein
MDLIDSNKGKFQSSGLTISYKELGTITLDELAHAVWEDIQTLKDLYNVRYVRPLRLKIYLTDEFGDEIKLRRPGGGNKHFMRTCHYRPACIDYDL